MSTVDQSKFMGGSELANAEMKKMGGRRRKHNHQDGGNDSNSSPMKMDGGGKCVKPAETQEPDANNNCPQGFELVDDNVASGGRRRHRKSKKALKMSRKSRKSRRGRKSRKN